MKWNKVYVRAVNDGINEVIGTNAIRDFLGAVGARFEPSWARTMLDNIITNEAQGIEDKRTLRDFGLMFYALTVAHKLLRYAITKYKDPELSRPPKEEEDKKTKERYKSKHWEKLRAQIAKDRWGKSSTTEETKFPAEGSISAAIINPSAIQAYEQHVGVYNIISAGKHPLSLSTLLNNCGAMHLVNNVNLLEPGSYKETEGEFVEAGASTFPILGRGTRVLKKLLNGVNGP
ncbi:hypothetical protein MAJ_07844, partial [Metarhizium majus ARSEF 297]